MSGQKRLRPAHGPFAEYEMGKQRVPRSVKSYVKSCNSRMLEKKGLTTGATGTAPTTGGTLHPLGTYQIQQGTGDAQRVGNVIQPYRLVLNFTYILDATSDGNAVRVIVFQDQQSNGAAPAVLNVLEVASYLSPPSSDFAQGWGGNRIKILSDKTTTLNCNTATDFAVGLPQHHRHSKKDLARVYYNGTAGTAADIQKGSLYFLVIARAATGTFDYYFNLAYTDA